MKTKRLIPTLVLTVLMFGCVSQNYLPRPDKIDVNEYGSFIEVRRYQGLTLKGELISLDSNQMVIMTWNKKAPWMPVVVPMKEISSFSLRYARPGPYGWTIPVLSLSTITHGFFSLLTFPINLVVTSVVTATGARAYRYSQSDIGFSQLKMFARYPQGIPPGIDLATLQ